MKDKIRSIFISLHTWQIMLFAVIGAVMITDSITALISLWIWHMIQLSLIVLGTINAILVPLIILPFIIRNLHQVVKLEEQNRNHIETITQLENQRQIEATVQRRADEMSLLYQLSVSLASGKNLYDTLLALQAEILKLVQADAFYVAIYDADTDLVRYPIFFDEGSPKDELARHLHERPGLTGAVIFGGKTLYLPDMFDPEAKKIYNPVDENDLVLNTFLGIPLISNGQAIGMLSVQSARVDAYTADQIQLMENVAVQAAIAIDKASLLDQVQAELTERKRAQDQLREREVILEAVTFAAEQFLKTPDWRVNINLVLERLGRTLKTTHTYIFKDHLNPQGEPVTSMTYEWTAAGYPSDLDGTYFQNSLLHQEGYEEQVAALQRGDVRIGNSSTFNPIEKESMAELGVKSILEVPIFVNDKTWGVIGFDDFEQERAWSNAEVESLKIAAGVLSAAIQRDEAEAAVRESERIYRQAIEAAGAVPYYQDYKIDKYQFIGEGIQKLTGYTSDEMTLSLWDSILQEQELVGDLAGLDVDEVAQRVRNGELSYWRCDVRILTRDGQSKWIADSAIELFDVSGISYASIGIMQDITERKHIEASLRQREAMLAATTYAAEQFLKSSDWRLSMEHVLERLGKAFHASHAYLFEHSVGVDKLEYSSLKYEWTAPGQVSDFDNPHYRAPHPVNLNDESTDYDLRQGHIFIGNSSTFPPAERERLFNMGVKAMVEVPLFVDGAWWGTFGVDDFEIEREWSSAEVDALKIAVGILSGAIQRQNTEDAVHESERIYRQAIEAAGAFPYYRDYRFDSYQFMGHGFQSLTGYAPDEMRESFWNSIVQEYKLVGDLAGFELKEAGERVRNGEFNYWKCDYRILARDGQSKWIADSSIELFDASGKSYGSIGIMQDITERKQIEASLRYRESILEAITSAAELFIKLPDWQMEINQVLEQLGKAINASHAYVFENHLTVEGMEVTSIKFEWNADAVSNDLEADTYKNIPLKESDMERWYDILSHGAPFVADKNLEDVSEKEFLNARGIQSMLDVPIFVNGTWWGVMGFDDMFNEREWSGVELDALKIAANILSAAIERQIAAAALDQELSHRKRLIGELEAKNTELERFTYTVSHDLKSPLVTINGFLGYLEQDAASGNMERLKKDTTRIQEAVNKMQRLLSELLELSRIGRIMNTPATVSFDDLVREAMDIVRGQINASGVVIRVQPHLSTVFVDKPRIIEVLQNLFDNAIKYMGDQPQPQIEIGQRFGENGQPIFYIRDNGIGIAPEYHERIFGLFNKLDAKSEGTGVGLALVKRIIEVHKGQVWVESTLGQGSTFYFTLPQAALLM